MEDRAAGEWCSSRGWPGKSAESKDGRQRSLLLHIPSCGVRGEG